jgi:hypothetical protein
MKWTKIEDITPGDENLNLIVKVIINLLRLYPFKKLKERELI